MCSSCAPEISLFYLNGVYSVLWYPNAAPPIDGSCVCMLICVHTWVCFCCLCMFNIFRTLHMTGRKEAKNLTLNSRKSSLLPLHFVQKYLFRNTSGVKMLWVDVFHLWNAKFWNYQKIHGATSRNWGFLPANVSRMFWQISLKKICQVQWFQF